MRPSDAKATNPNAAVHSSTGPYPSPYVSPSCSAATKHFWSMSARLGPTTSKSDGNKYTRVAWLKSLGGVGGALGDLVGRVGANVGECATGRVGDLDGERLGA